MNALEEDPAVIGEWSFVKQIGRGSFGVVSLWSNKKTKETIAVKKCVILQNDTENRTKQEKRWRNEVEFMRNIRNPFIVEAKNAEDYDFLATLAMPATNPSLQPLLAMEYCEGGDLRSLLNSKENVNGLGERDIRALLTCLRNAISYLHDSKIIHRDIKPENIVILENDDENKTFKLTDLGYAKSLEETTKSLVGTVEYLAPELFENCKSYTKTVDFWSFGIITFEVICGYRPFLPNLPIPTRMAQQRIKTSNQIAITEDNEKKLHFHETLPDEIIFTNILKQSLEDWLRLALELNPKERGGPCDETGENFAIFSNLDDILERKMLTIFSLCTNSMLRYEIKTDETIAHLYKWLEMTLHKSQSALCVIPPAYQNDIQNNTLLKHLYIENLFDKPMLYVIHLGTIIDSGNVRLNLSPDLTGFLGSKDTTFRPIYLREIIRKLIFYIKNERTQYMHMLNGFKEYGMYLEQVIVNLRQPMNQLEQKHFYVNGALYFYEITWTDFQEAFSTTAVHDYEELAILEKWKQSHELLLERKSKIDDARNRINHIYSSLCGRIRSSIDQLNILAPNDVDTTIDVSRAETLYEKIRLNTSMKHSTELVKNLKSIFINFFKQRDVVLHSPKFIRDQRNLQDIHVELNKIQEMMSNFFATVQQLSTSLKASNKILVSNVVSMFDKMAKKTDNYDSNMLKISLPESITGINNQNLSCFGEGDDVRSLLEDNNAILATMDDLIEELDVN